MKRYIITLKQTPDATCELLIHSIERLGGSVTRSGTKLRTKLIIVSSIDFDEKSFDKAVAEFGVSALQVDNDY